MSTALVIPSLNGPILGECLSAVRRLDPAPDRVVLVLSGAGAEHHPAAGAEAVRSSRRLGFAAAVNRGLAEVTDAARVAVLNDDALPDPGWLGPLHAALDADPSLAAVQGTVLAGDGATVDGRGISFDHWGLPVQVDRGQPATPEPGGRHDVLAVSATAALLRADALHQVALTDGWVFDQRFDSYHEDVDLGLRLHRAGWQTAWVAGATVRHIGSSTGPRLRWHHPWWVLANRWRALAGNMSPRAVLCALPCLLRGEVRAVRTLARVNPRALLVAPTVLLALPTLLTAGLLRSSSGARFDALPGGGW